jgi:tetratricopeptide (TPR) repeat protein
VIARRLARLLCTLSLAALCAIGCSQRHRAADDPWVAEAARRHALADERLEAGDRPGARDALRGIVDAPPPAELPPDDRRGVLQDTYFRLARIDLDARDARAALADAERGLALGQAGDLFVANLLVVRGAAHEALGEGPAAAEDYHRALMINDQLLAKALHQPAGARAPGDGP